VGIFKNDPRAYPGYTLFAPKHHTMIYLMDNEGRAVHSWKSQYEPGQSVYLLENGHLLHCCFTKNRGFTSGGEGGRLEEFDWDGNLVWAFEYSTDQHLSHHDIKPLPNGNVLVLAVEKKSYEDCMAAGFNPRMMRDQQLFPEFFIEVQPTRPKGGKIVWEWHVWDHLIQENDRTKANYGNVAKHPELIDVNCNGRATPAFWNHGNSIAYICSDTEGHFFEVTTTGELVWEYINPVTRDGAVKVLGDVLPMTNSAFRAYRYAADHPAFKGRDLTPKGTITERAAQGLDVRPKRRPPQGKGDGQQRGGKGDQRDAGERRGDQTPPGGERPSRDGGHHVLVVGGDRPQGGSRRGFGRSLLARALDADGDGVLSTAEMENAAVALKALDKNGDGKLTADEIDDGTDSVAPDGRKRRPGGPLMRLLDTDRNSELSAEETRNAPAVLKAADRNKDGKLTPEELDAAGGGGRGPGGGEGGGRRGNDLNDRPPRGEQDKAGNNEPPPPR
jgi:hypothetical protein